MSVKRKRQKKSKAKLFDADVIATTMHQMLSLDLGSVQQEYKRTPALDYFVAEQQKVFRKKYLSVESPKREMEEKAFQSFREVNSKMLDTNLKLLLTLPEGPHRLQSHTDRSHKIHLRARALVHWVLGDCPEEEWFLHCKNSAGSSLGVPFVDTSAEQKFAFPLTATRRAAHHFERYLSWDFQFHEELMFFNSAYHGEMFDIVSASRATTVDKDDRKRRFICVEATVNMFLQQGLMHMMYKRLEAIGLDVRVLPELHKLRAWLSSISGREATVDWSQASDCNAIELVRWLTPPKWFNRLEAVRMPFTSLKGEILELQMISTMGNATTFPLELLIFWAYGHAVRLTEQRSNTLFPEWEDLKCISVFGDDCILPTDLAPRYVEFMSGIGHSANMDKSFMDADDPFRESCGGDYHGGFDVRPLFLKAPQNRRPSSLAPWLYNILNAVLRMYIRIFGPMTYVYDKALLGYIFSLFRKHNMKICVVPPSSPTDSGLLWSKDHDRLRVNYRFLSEPLIVDRHGTVSYKYHRFVYRQRYKQSDALRYCMNLRDTELRNFMRAIPDAEDYKLRDLYNPLRIPKGAPSLPFNQRRRMGGYVVARGFTCHWYVR